MQSLRNLLVVALLGLSFSGSAQQKVQFYVSPGGNDHNNGALDHPFATIARAKDAIRQLPRDPKHDAKVTMVTVFLRNGIYTSPDAPLTFTPADGGDAFLAVTYAAYRKEKVIFSGGRTIGGWHPGKGGVWEVRLPAAAAGEKGLRQLYRNGQRLPRGRFPVGDSLLTIAALSSDYRVITLKEAATFPSFPGKMTEVVVLTNWNEERIILDSAVGNILYLHDPAAWVGHYGCAARVGMPLYLENAPEFVTRPGDWYFDEKTGILSYKASPGENPRKATFIAPIARKVLVVEGTAAEPVRNLHFSGITFSYAAFPLPDSGYRGLQAGYYGYQYLRPPVYMEPSAVDFSYAAYCSLENCIVTHVGAGGIGVGAGCRRVEIAGTEVFDAGGNGISVGQRNERLEQHYADWLLPEQAPDNTLLYNNYIHDCGATQFGDVGIFAAFCSNTLILRNTVAHQPYTGISLGFIWDTAATTMRNCTVAFNDVHDVMRLLADGGAIYTLGREPGSMLNGNLLYNVHRSSSAFGGAPNNAIFFDECSKGFYVKDNISYLISAPSPLRFNRNSPDDHTWGENDFGAARPGKDFPWDRARTTGSTLAGSVDHTKSGNPANPDNQETSGDRKNDIQ